MCAGCPNFFIYICSSQILTLITITTRIPPPSGTTSLPTGPAHIQSNMDQKESIGPRPKPTSGETLFTWIHYLTKVVQLFRDSNSWYKYPFRSYPRLQHDDPSKPATYRWTTQSLWFADPAMPSHVPNIITPIYQCGLLWIVSNISAWLSQHSSGRSRQLSENHNVQIIQLRRSEILNIY